MSWVSLLVRAGSARGRVLLQPHVLDLVEQRSITDLEHLGGFHAVPPALLERAADHFALGLEHGAARDLLEREALGGRERLGRRRRRRRHRRGRHQRAWQREIRSTIIRLMKFSSSRMLPGHAYCMKADIASGDTSRSGKLNSREYRR